MTQESHNQEHLDSGQSVSEYPEPKATAPTEDPESNDASQPQETPVEPETGEPTGASSEADASKGSDSGEAGDEVEETSDKQGDDNNGSHEDSTEQEARFADLHQTAATLEFLSPKHCEAITPNDLEQRISDYIVNEAQIREWANLLKQRHILILSGQPRLGKTVIALAIAQTLCSEVEGIESILSCTNLTQNVRIDPYRISGVPNEFGNKILVVDYGVQGDAYPANDFILKTRTRRRIASLLTSRFHQERDRRAFLESAFTECKELLDHFQYGGNAEQFTNLLLTKLVELGQACANNHALVVLLEQLEYSETDISRKQTVQDLLWEVKGDLGLKRHNEDNLGRFVSDLAVKEFQSLNKKLADNHIYIIFTVTEEAFGKSSSLSRLQEARLLHEVPLPTPGLVETALRRRMDLCRTQDPDRIGQLERSLQDNPRLYRETLDTIPKAILFIEAWLDTSDPDLSPEVVLQRIDNVKPWLFETVAPDFDVWSFVLALLLCYPSRRTEAVSWFQFHLIHVEIERFLRRAIANRNGLNKKGESVLAEAGLGVWLQDEKELLKRARAEVWSQPGAPATPFISFRDRSYPERLWQTLFESGRAALGQLVPLLHELIEHPNQHLRWCALCALGRIGVLDFDYITAPLIRQLSRSDEYSDHVNIGVLFQGILGCGDKNYLKQGLEWLRGYAMSNDEKQLRAGIIPLREIGLVDLDLAMQMLRRIVQRRLVAKIEDFGQWELALEKVRQQVSKTSTHAVMGKVADQVHDRMWEKLLREVLFSKIEIELIRAICYSIVGLCFAKDPTEVIGYLLEWMRSDRQRLGPITALLLIGSRYSIIEVVERYPIVPPTTDSEMDTWGGAPQAVSRLLYAASLSGSSILLLVDFWEALYESVEVKSFPPLLKRYLQGRIREHIEHWALEDYAGISPELDHNVTELFISLCNSEIQDFSRDIRELLRNHPESKREDSAIGRLAVQALTRRPTRRSDQVEALVEYHE